MKVRGWLMIGDSNTARTLPPEKVIVNGFMTIGGPPPVASQFQVGDWVVWAPVPSQAPVTLVCVEIPL